MSLHEQLRILVSTHGPSILDAAEGFRGALDDFLAEDEATAGELNLLVDAVRLGAVRRLVELLDQAAEPQAALTEAAAQLARDRDTDPVRARWALALLGYALGGLDATIPSVVIEEERTRSAADASAPVVTEPVPATTPIEPEPLPPVEPAPTRSRTALWVGLAVAAVLVIGVGTAIAVQNSDDDGASPSPADSSAPEDGVDEPPSEVRCGSASYDSSARVSSTHYGVQTVSAVNVECPVAKTVALASVEQGGTRYVSEGHRCVPGELTAAGKRSYVCTQIEEQGDGVRSTVTFVTLGNG